MQSDSDLQLFYSNLDALISQAYSSQNEGNLYWVANLYHVRSLHLPQFEIF